MRVRELPSSILVHGNRGGGGGGSNLYLGLFLTHDTVQAQSDNLPIHAGGVEQSGWTLVVSMHRLCLHTARYVRSRYA